MSYLSLRGLFKFTNYGLINIYICLMIVKWGLPGHWGQWCVNMHTYDSYEYVRSTNLCILHVYYTIKGMPVTSTWFSELVLRLGCTNYSTKILYYYYCCKSLMDCACTNMKGNRVMHRRLGAGLCITLLKSTY